MDDTPNLRRVDHSLATAGLPTEEPLRSLALEYIHIPVDFTAPPSTDLERFCHAMDANRARKRFVHCALNKRASAFLGLCRVARLGWHREAAFEMMRDLWEPDAVWRAFIDKTLAERGPR